MVLLYEQSVILCFFHENLVLCLLSLIVFAWLTHAHLSGLRLNINFLEELFLTPD